MTALRWLFAAQLVVAGHPILWREIIGNALGMASAIGGMRRRVWAWPVGVAGNVLLLTVFLGVAFGNPQGATLYGQAARQVFFIAVSAYGWVRWARHRSITRDSAAVSPHWAGGRQRAAALGLSTLAVLACFLGFRAIGAGFPAPWWYFLADSWIFVGSMLATYAMARGWVEFWMCWLAVDAVGVPELLHFRFYPSAALYGIYGLLVLWGFVVWRRLAGASGQEPGRPAESLSPA